MNIEKNKEGFDFAVNYKDKTKYFIINSILEGDVINKIKNVGYYGIFTLNNMPNIKFVISNWKVLIDFEFLSIFFVNPFSSSGKVWTISPYTHDKICDKSSLEVGLRSMAEMVEYIDTEQLINKVRLLR